MPPVAPALLFAPVSPVGTVNFFLIAAFIYLGLTILAMTGMHFLEKRAGRGFKRSAS